MVNLLCHQIGIISCDTPVATPSLCAVAGIGAVPCLFLRRDAAPMHAFNTHTHVPSHARMHHCRWRLNAMALKPSAVLRCCRLRSQTLPAGKCFRICVLDGVGVKVGWPRGMCVPTRTDGTALLRVIACTMELHDHSGTANRFIAKALPMHSHTSAPADPKQVCPCAVPTQQLYKLFFRPSALDCVHG